MTKQHISEDRGRPRLGLSIRVPASKVDAGSVEPQLKSEEEPSANSDAVKAVGRKPRRGVLHFCLGEVISISRRVAGRPAGRAGWAGRQACRAGPRQVHQAVRQTASRSALLRADSGEGSRRKDHAQRGVLSGQGRAA